MKIVNTLLNWIVNLISSLLPIFNLPEEFVNGLDLAISQFIDIVNAAGYFIPLGTLSMCIMIIILFDNFSLLFRLGQWIIELIRG